MRSIDITCSIHSHSHNSTQRLRTTEQSDNYEAPFHRTADYEQNVEKREKDDDGQHMEIINYQEMFPLQSFLRHLSPCRLQLDNLQSVKRHRTRTAKLGGQDVKLGECHVAESEQRRWTDGS
ncbi:unnamed protein product [Caenorhabditis brenneri]